MGKTVEPEDVEKDAIASQRTFGYGVSSGVWKLRLPKVIYLIHKMYAATAPYPSRKPEVYSWSGKQERKSSTLLVLDAHQRSCKHYDLQC